MSCLPLYQPSDESAELDLDAKRPTTRAECPESRPCPWVGCRYHLYLDVNPKTGALRLRFPDRDPLEMAESCALDVAERSARQGGLTLKEVGRALNLTKERIRQIQVEALDNMGEDRHLLE